MVGWVARLFLAPARARHVYAVAAAIGLATYLVVYGTGHLSGSSAYWTMPQTDERMFLMGYRYFLHEPWQWPVFVSHAIDVPYTTSVAFSDSIPIWALTNKAIATVAPPWGPFSADAYLGLWHGLAYALQACFGVACLRALGHRSWRTGIVTALFFLAVPAWIFRYGHDALSAHWVELWAIWLYLRTPAGTPAPRRLGIAKLGQLTVAALITPYHPVMCLGVFLASLLRSRDAKTIAIWLPLGVGCVVIATWFAGYFSGEGAVAQWGFAKQSTNVLSWLVPVRSGILGDGRWIANVTATDWQWEGYAYLGLGYLALLALFLPHVRSLRGVIERHVFLFVVALAFWLLALSNHIYVGSHEVATYSIPSVLRWFPSQFRAPGRFVWVPMYVLIVFLLHWAFLRFSTGRRFAVLVVLVVVQLIDARGDWALQRATTEGPRSSVLELGAWRPLVHAHDAVFIHPTFACLTGDRTSWLSDVSTGVQMLASERGTPINGTYNTRTKRTCAVEERAWPSLELRPGALYVVLPQARAIADRLETAGARCGAFDTVRVCSTHATAIDAAFHAGILHASLE